MRIIPKGVLRKIFTIQIATLTKYLIELLDFLKYL